VDVDLLDVLGRRGAVMTHKVDLSKMPRATAEAGRAVIA